jgi:hypothetical protein
MDPATRDRLVNLLARTTSEHDGEALAAARKANQLLVRHGLTWADVVSIRTPDPSARRTTGASADGSRSAAAPDSWYMGAGVGSNPNRRSPTYSPAHRWRPSPQRIARICLRYGFWIGILLGGVVALFTAIADDATDPSDYALAALAFALPTFLGFVLWLMFGGWLPQIGVPRRSRPYRGPK